LVFSDESETWTSYDDYSSYDDDDEELQSQIELIQEQMSQRNRFPKSLVLMLPVELVGSISLPVLPVLTYFTVIVWVILYDGHTSSSKLSLFVNLRRDVKKIHLLTATSFSGLNSFLLDPKWLSENQPRLYCSVIHLTD